MTRIRLVLACWTIAVAMTVIGAADEGATNDKNIERSEGTQQKWALLIGVNNYSNVGKLKYCADDIRELAKQFAASGFPKEHVILMDDSAKEIKYLPFKNNIDSQMELLTSGANSKDLVVVAFSGHGVCLKDGSSYLCPADADPNKPELTLLSLENIYKTLETCKAQQKLLLVDACRNEFIPGRKGADDAAGSMGFVESLRNMTPREIAVLSSCAVGQTSWEDQKLGHGVFMNFLIEGLKGHADYDKDNSVTIPELFEYSAKKTKLHVRDNHNSVQTPMLLGNTSSFEIAKLTGPPAPELMQPVPNRLKPSATDSPRVARLLEQGDQYYADSDYDTAIHTYENAINLMPQNQSSYSKRGAAYLAKGDIKMAVADYQMAGQAMSLPVRVAKAQLMKGGSSTATVTEGQILSVTRIQVKGKVHWLGVTAVNGNPASAGWLAMDAVEKPVAPRPAPVQTVRQETQPTNGSGYSYPRSSYQGNNSGVDDDAQRTNPILYGDARTKTNAAEKAAERAERLRTPAAQRTADNKARVAERAQEKLQNARGGR